MKLAPRYILILSIAGVLLAVAALAALLVLPQIGRLSELDRQVTEANDRVVQSQSLLQRRLEAKANSAFTDAALLKLVSAVPENPDLPSLMIELQDVAYESNVQLRRIEPKELIQANGYVSMPVEISCWGSWTDTVDFVQRLSKVSRQLRIVESTSRLLSESDAEKAVEDLELYPVDTVITVETYLIPTEQAGTTSAPQGSGQ